MGFLGEFPNTIIITAAKIKIIPQTIFTDKCSWNTATPINTAVTGSKAPKMADNVGPINLMAIVIVSKEIMVGIMAEPIKQLSINQEFIGCNSKPKFEEKKKTNKPKNIT